MNEPLSISIPVSQLRAWATLLDKANGKEVAFSKDQVVMANRVIEQYDAICTDVGFHIKTAIHGVFE